MSAIRRPTVSPRALGFTLVEMLVAVAIFALASALAYGGLASLLRARAQLDATNERLGRLQFAIGLIERDLRSIAARGIRDEYGAARSPLDGVRDRLAFTRNGFANALSLPRAELERVGYRVLDGELRRERHAALDRTPSSPRIEDTLLDGVQRMELGYRASDGRSTRQWPPPRTSDEVLPRAVVVTLTVDGFGEIERVLELPVERRP